MSFSLQERFFTSNVVVSSQTVANAEVLANQESSSGQVVPPNTDGKALLPSGLPPLSINTGRVTEGFGIRSRSWHEEEVGLHCLILICATMIINHVSKYVKFSVTTTNTCRNS